VTGAQAETLAELAGALGIDAAQLEATVHEFNAAIRDDVPFDAAVKDGRAADVEPRKSNWARAL
jgi:tricarballylate dehydrogenase